MAGEEVLGPADAGVGLERDAAEKLEHPDAASAAQLVPQDVGEHRRGDPDRQSRAEVELAIGVAGSILLVMPALSTIAFRGLGPRPSALWDAAP